MSTNDVSELVDDTTPVRGWLSAGVCWCVLDPPRAPHAGVVAPAHARGGRVGGRAGRSRCFCFVWSIYECGDAVGAQSFLTKTPYGTGTVDLRVCDFAMCVKKWSKTLTDAADMEDGMAGFVSNT